MFFEVVLENGKIKNHSNLEFAGITGYSYIINSSTIEVVNNVRIIESAEVTQNELGEPETIIVTHEMLYVTYSPMFVELGDYKSVAKANMVEQDTVVNEVTLTNGLKFDDNQESLNYLQTKRATSNASEVVYDKHHTSETMTNAQLTTAVSLIASSIMAKDDEVKAKIMQINNAQSITEVQIITGLLQEKIVKLIVDVDGTQFDDVNQTTDESLNQVVMPVSGNLDLSRVSWLNAKGIKSINGQSISPQQIIDSNNVHTANVTFSADHLIVTSEVIADGSPVTVDMVVYC